MFDPWGMLEALSGWTIRSAPTRNRGRCDWATKTITLDPALTRAERRAVLAHELVHAMRGPFPRWMRAREEQQVREAASRLLIDLPPLIDAVTWSRHPIVIAEILDVDPDTVAARAECLDPDERAAIEAHLENIHLP